MCIKNVHQKKLETWSSFVCAGRENKTIGIGKKLRACLAGYFQVQNDKLLLIFIENKTIFYRQTSNLSGVDLF